MALLPSASDHYDPTMTSTKASTVRENGLLQLELWDKAKDAKSYELSMQQKAGNYKRYI
jgi:hypothetical protein